MTKQTENIIRMAREAGIKGVAVGWNAWTVDLERFAALVAVAEREACAKVCVNSVENADIFTLNKCAAAIRARGTHEHD